MIAKRIARIDETIKTYVSERDYTTADFDVEDTDIIDLLTDLLHWSQANAVNLNNCLAMATIHYEEEKED